MERQGTMRRFVGALLRRMAERVDPKPRITINTHYLGNCNDLGTRLAAEIKRHDRRGLA